MRIILTGFGTVGGAFVKILCEKETELLKFYGLRPSVIAVINSKGAIINPSGLNLEELKKTKESSNLNTLSNFKVGVSGVEVIENLDAEVVVDTTPTNIINGQPGLSHIMTALKKKQHVITTSKGPLALALPALMELAAYNKVFLRFSGTVGGGTPILDLGKKCLVGDKILSVRGILNGTTNYILTQMDESAVTMDDALQDAQMKGYAEKDPSYDIEGIDSACKLVIISNWLLSKNVTIKDIKIEGITKITPEDVKEAKDKNHTIKLIASADEKDLTVKPTLIPRNHPLFVGGVLNAVTFKTEYAGEVTITGRGAGGIETEGAILRDLIDIRRGITL